MFCIFRLCALKICRTRGVNPFISQLSIRRRVAAGNTAWATHTRTCLLINYYLTLISTKVDRYVPLHCHRLRYMNFPVWDIAKDQVSMITQKCDSVNGDDGVCTHHQQHQHHHHHHHHYRHHHVADFGAISARVSTFLSRFSIFLLDLSGQQ